MTDERERVKKNLEEGRGFRLDKALQGGGKGGDFMFASANELWRASLDTIDFMSISNVDYAGGLIITDWYSEGNPQEAVKITITFLTNEVRSDAIDVDIFYKKCIAANNCKINKQDGQLKKEITKQILAKAATYQKISKDKNYKPYRLSSEQRD